MNWTREKPRGSGWYQFVGDLHPIGEEKGGIHCDPACRVAVHFDENPFIAVYQDTGLYDYERADGLWSSPEEELAQPATGNLPDE